jgi:hypothetical protein
MNCHRVYRKGFFTLEFWHFLRDSDNAPCNSDSKSHQLMVQLLSGGVLASHKSRGSVVADPELETIWATVNALAGRGGDDVALIVTEGSIRPGHGILSETAWIRRWSPESQVNAALSVKRARLLGVDRETLFFQWKFRRSRPCIPKRSRPLIPN